MSRKPRTSGESALSSLSGDDPAVGMALREAIRLKSMLHDTVSSVIGQVVRERIAEVDLDDDPLAIRNSYAACMKRISRLLRGFS
jgi:hypothetical protein